MSWGFWLVVALWGVVILLGGLISYYAFRSYRSTRSASMLALAGGLFLISTTTGSMWLWFYFTGDNYFVASVTCTAITAAGFGVIFYALRSRLS